MMLEKVHPSSFTALEVLDRVLDKGIVIDAVSRVSLAGTELVTVRAHVVVTSIETCLQYFTEDAATADPGPGHEEPRRRPSPQATPVVEFPAFLAD
jgi:gas vesicle structural protein